MLSRLTTRALPAAAALAAALAGCGTGTARTIGTIVFAAPAACKSSQPLSGTTKQQLTLTLTITNTETTPGVGKASSQWLSTFVTLDPGPNLRLDNLYAGTKSPNPPQQVDTHEYAFGPLDPKQTKTVVAQLTPLRAASTKLTVAAWGGDDPADIPTHPPSVSCSVTIQ